MHTLKASGSIPSCRQQRHCDASEHSGCRHCNQGMVPPTGAPHSLNLICGDRSMAVLQCCHGLGSHNRQIHTPATRSTASHSRQPAELVRAPELRAVAHSPNAPKTHISSRSMEALCTCPLSSSGSGGISENLKTPERHLQIKK